MTIETLTNRMWFSVVCTLIDNDIRHHSGQNLLWTHKVMRAATPTEKKGEYFSTSFVIS